MAIAFDVATDGGNASATSLTFSHTCTGANRILFVAVDTQTADNTDYITGVTYNSVGMTRVDQFRSPGQGGSYLYMLVAPATGANNVVISASGSVSIYAVSASYTGVLQTGQPDTASGNAADPATTLTVNVTTNADKCWLISSIGEKNSGGQTISSGTNTTSRKINGTVIAIGDSNTAETPAGSFGQTWNLGGATGLAVHVIAIAPGPDTATSVQGYAFLL